MGVIDATTRDGVSAPRMADGEDRLDGPLVNALAAALADATARGSPLVLVGRRFFWTSTGWARRRRTKPAGSSAGPTAFSPLASVPGATVAALNGHAFGAGAILAAAADYRAQRADRGYFCFPAVDLGPMSDERRW